MADIRNLTILHSNDLHGDFLAEEVDEKLMGGVSRLSGYINKVRDEEPNTIYAVAGDMFRGSVIDSEYQGMSTIEIMNLLGPDVVSLGNHEIDYGIAHLIFLERCSKFPIVNANLYIKTTGQRLFNAYKILKVGGMNIMFIGILTEAIMDRAKSDQLLGSFVNVAEAAREVGKICNAYKKVDIDFTVLLTHIGFEEDKQLAALLDPDWGVDVIIGGHSHTLLTEPAKVNNVLIVQAGTGTDQIGRFDIKVDVDHNDIESYEWKTIPIDEKHCPRDIALENVIKKYKDVTDQKYGRVLTHFTRQLTHPARTQETEMGNLFSDILAEELGVDLMILGSGSIRLEQMGPILEFGELVEVYPYDDGVYHMQVTGAQLRRMFKQIFRDEAWEGHSEFYQVSKGIHVRYNKTDKEIKALTFNGVDVADDQIFNIGLQKYHYENFEKFLGVPVEEVEALRKPKVVATSCIDIFDEYFTTHPHLTTQVEGRMVIEE